MSGGASALTVTSAPSIGAAASHLMSACAACTLVTVASALTYAPLNAPFDHLARRSTSREAETRMPGQNQVCSSMVGEWTESVSALVRSSLQVEPSSKVRCTLS